MSVKDLPFVTVEQVVILRQAAIDLEQRAEAAEAKLRELEMQEPFGYVVKFQGDFTFIDEYYKNDLGVFPVYTNNILKTK